MYDAVRTCRRSTFSSLSLTFPPSSSPSYIDYLCLIYLVSAYNRPRVWPHRGSGNRGPVLPISVSDSDAAHQRAPQSLTASGVMIPTYAPFLKHTHLVFLNSSETHSYIPLIVPLEFTAWTSHLRYSTQGCIRVPRSCWMTPNSRNCTIRILSSRACDVLIMLFSTIREKGRRNDVC